jgi:hypothetical protein
MLLYFEFEERRVQADVKWPEDDEPIEVHVLDKQIAEDFPTDLFFDVEDGKQVTFIIEDKDNERLIDLQTIISRRLQEFVTKS